MKQPKQNRSVVLYVYRVLYTFQFRGNGGRTAEEFALYRQLEYQSQYTELQKQISARIKAVDSKGAAVIGETAAVLIESAQFLRQERVPAYALQKVLEAMKGKTQVVGSEAPEDPDAGRPDQGDPEPAPPMPGEENSQAGEAGAEA